MSNGRMSRPKSCVEDLRSASLMSCSYRNAVLKRYVPMLASAVSGRPGSVSGCAGFSWKAARPGHPDSAPRVPKAPARATGTSMAPDHASGRLTPTCPRDHGSVVHLVDVIAGENQHIGGVVALRMMSRCSGTPRPAVPKHHHEVSMRCCAGSSSTNSPNSPRRKPQPFTDVLEERVRL